MAPIALETENHIRDADFHKAMHGKSAETKGFRSMLNKDHEAHRLASEEYFKHWDNKYAGTETAEVREACYSSLLLANTILLTHQLGSKSRVCDPHKTLLQPRNRPVRIWLGKLIPLLPIRLWRRLPSGHCTT